MKLFQIVAMVIVVVGFSFAGNETVPSRVTLAEQLEAALQELQNSDNATINFRIELLSKAIEILGRITKCRRRHGNSAVEFQNQRQALEAQRTALRASMATINGPLPAGDGQIDTPVVNADDDICDEWEIVMAEDEFALALATIANFNRGASCR
ncbi:MAG: hypothetical protein V4534_02650 [Myxococcota bacterium]